MMEMKAGLTFACMNLKTGKDPGKREAKPHRFLLILKKIKRKEVLKKNGATIIPNTKFVYSLEPVFLNTGFICYMAAAS